MCHYTSGYRVKNEGLFIPYQSRSEPKVSTNFETIPFE